MLMPGRRYRKDVRLGVIHCAATPNGYNRYTIADIDEWHKAKNGWIRPRVGEPTEGSGPWRYCAYSYVIHTDGAKMPGRGLDEIPSATRGHNSHSVAICLIGTDAFTPAQWASLSELCDQIDVKIGHRLQWVGHRDYSNKTCPGFDVGLWYDDQNRVPLERHVCKERLWTKK